MSESIEVPRRSALAWNVRALLLGALPLFLVLVWVYSLVTSPGARKDLLTAFPAEFLAGYILLGLPFFGIGSVQLALVNALPRHWATAIRRGIAVGLAPAAALLATVFISRGVLGLGALMVPLVTSLAIFGSVMRLPDDVTPET